MSVDSETDNFKEDYEDLPKKPFIRVRYFYFYFTPAHYEYYKINFKYLTACVGIGYLIFALF